MPNGRESSKRLESSQRMVYTGDMGRCGSRATGAAGRGAGPDICNPLLQPANVRPVAWQGAFTLRLVQDRGQVTRH